MPRSILTQFLAIILMIHVPGAAAYPQGGQNADPLKREFRGAMIATEYNFDWPSSPHISTEEQQEELATIFEALHRDGFNAVFFQVRIEGDALYESTIVPWSYWVTGDEGQGPAPLYDPLFIALQEARERGMELHASFSPLRIHTEEGVANHDQLHVSVEHPEWIITVPEINHSFLDPGIPEVRDHVVSVIMEVVRNYDIDGIHLDHNFYPTPVEGVFPGIEDEDGTSFEEHDRGFSDPAEWRRDNLNILIAAISDSIQSVKPHIKFGVSPPGIWRDGVPAGVSGLDAYESVFMDAVAWVEGGWVDYLAPQLYWPFGGDQDYGLLAAWWSSVMDGRHLYPLLAAHRTDDRTYDGDAELYDESQIPDQIRFNRDHEGIHGNVLYRAENVVRHNSLGISDTLRTDLYRYPSLIPTMDWKDLEAPSPLQTVLLEPGGNGGLLFRWDPSETGEEDRPILRYAVYRILAADEPDLPADLENARNLLAVVPGPTFEDDPPPSDSVYYYVVTALSRNFVESGPSEPVEIVIPVSAEPGEAISGYMLHGNYPNPFNPQTTIYYTVGQPLRASLSVYDVTGRLVQRLVSEQMLAPGTYEVVWDGSYGNGGAAGSGVYFYVLETADSRLSRAMMLVR